jgi:hypothetical protein
MICPRCKIKLIKTKNEFGIFFVCPSCDGRSVSLSVIRKSVSHDIVKDLWNKTFSCHEKSETWCPACNNIMTLVTLATLYDFQRLNWESCSGFVGFEYLPFTCFAWVLYQIIGVTFQVSGISNVSSLAHLGGGIAIFLFWLFIKLENSDLRSSPPAGPI